MRGADLRTRARLTPTHAKASFCRLKTTARLFAQKGKKWSLLHFYPPPTALALRGG